MYLYLLLFVFTLIALSSSFMNAMVFLLLASVCYYYMRSYEKVPTSPGAEAKVAEIEKQTEELMK